MTQSVTLQKKLDDMNGGLYLYCSHQYRILGFTITDKAVIIKTDKKRIFTFDIDDLIWVKLNEFSLIYPGSSDPIVDVDEPDDGDVDELVLPELVCLPQARMADLTDAVFRNIALVEKSAEHIPQAEAVNAGVQVLLSAAKVELELIKTVQSLKKKGGRKCLKVQ